MAELLEFFQKEGAVILQAPVTFALALALCSGVIWLVLRREFTVPTAHRESELKLTITERDAYKSKLDGASPDEARSKIEALEIRLRDMEHDPRLLSEDQLAKMAAVLKRNKPGAVIVSRDGSSLLCGRVQTQVRKFFEQHGWKVRHWATDAMSDLPASGLRVYGNTGETQSDDELIVREALTAAGIRHEVKRQDSNDRDPQLLFCDID